MMIGAVLVRCMPRRAVLELMLTGRLIDASEAKALGARVVPSDRLDEKIDALVGQLAAKSPATIRLGRDAFAVDDLDFDEAHSTISIPRSHRWPPPRRRRGFGLSWRSGHRSGWAGEPMDYRP